MNDSDSESDSEEIHCTASKGGRVCWCVCVYGGRVHALVEIARMLDLKYGQSSDASRMSRVDYNATTYSY